MKRARQVTFWKVFIYSVLISKTKPSASLAARSVPPPCKGLIIMKVKGSYVTFIIFRHSPPPLPRAVASTAPISSRAFVAAGSRPGTPACIYSITYPWFPRTMTPVSPKLGEGGWQTAPAYSIRKGRAILISERFCPAKDGSQSLLCHNYRAPFTSGRASCCRERLSRHRLCGTVGFCF